MELAEARAALQSARRVAVLTGAGVSAASGIPTFRDAQDGLWARYRPEDLATSEAYTRDPALVWRWYAWRYALCAQAQPNAAHRRLADLEAHLGSGFTLVTQNVDGLHARAGSRRVLELHGTLARARCERCGHTQALPTPEDFVPPPVCTVCGAPMRPDVVWFGEALQGAALDAARTAFETYEVALVIGTSGTVQPAASLAELARRAGALVIEVNPQATPLSARADLSLRLGAVEGLAEVLD